MKSVVVTFKGGGRTYLWLQDFIASAWLATYIVQWSWKVHMYQVFHKNTKVRVHLSVVKDEVFSEIFSLLILIQNNQPINSGVTWASWDILPTVEAYPFLQHNKNTHHLYRLKETHSPLKIVNYANRAALTWRHGRRGSIIGRHDRRSGECCWRHRHVQLRSSNYCTFIARHTCSPLFLQNIVGTRRFCYWDTWF